MGIRSGCWPAWTRGGGVGGAPQRREQCCLSAVINLSKLKQMLGHLGLGAEVREALTARVVVGIIIGGGGEGGAEENSEGKE